MDRNRLHLLSSLNRLARTLLGATLLVAILAASFPLLTLASGPICNLACCAGTAPHAAGSCMNGSCHAFLTLNAKAHIPKRAPHEKPEQLCGLRRSSVSASRVLWSVTINSSSADGSHSTRASKGITDQATVSTTVLNKPCQPDCDGWASGSSGSNRQQDAAALAYADRPRPPSAVGFGSVVNGLTQALGAMCRRGAPRGPPLSFS